MNLDTKSELKLKIVENEIKKLRKKLKDARKLIIQQEGKIKNLEDKLILTQDPFWTNSDRLLFPRDL